MFLHLLIRRSAGVAKAEKSSVLTISHLYNFPHLPLDLRQKCVASEKILEFLSDVVGKPPPGGAASKFVVDDVSDVSLRSDDDDDTPKKVHAAVPFLTLKDPRPSNSSSVGAEGEET